ncbi:MAG: hypothetical protein WAU89_25870 [Candidatus Acidiferrales bacterium]
MLVEDAERLTQLVAQYRAASSAKAQMQVLSQRTGQVHAFCERVHAVTEICELLKDHRVEFDAIEPLADGILPSVETLVEAAETPEALGGNSLKTQFNTLSNRGSAALDQIEKRLLVAWQTHVDGAMGKHDFGVLAEWDHVAEFRKAAREIRLIQTKLSELRNRLPDDERAFSLLKKFAQDLKDAWEQLDKTPPKVLKFLRQASSQEGAPLSLIDDEVRKWICERKMEDSFRVRAVATQPYAQ